MEKSKHFDTCGVAEYLGRTPAAIRALAMRRKIPFRKVNGRLMFLLDELDSWIESAPGLTLEEYRKRTNR